MAEAPNIFSAAEPGLGYIYQSRFALMKVLELPEDGLVYIERNDDVEFVTVEGKITLGSLKHKAVGERISDLSVDFWKSVRVWANHYKKSGRAGSDAAFILYSTATVSAGSFLQSFVGDGESDEIRATTATAVLATSKSEEIAKVKAELVDLTEDELQDFYGRITISSPTPRIEEIPGLIEPRWRTIRRQHRMPLFLRLEGWWSDLVINVLTNRAATGIKVQDVSDKLAILSEEFYSDNLPIDFRNSNPGQIDAVNDNRIFVAQLRALQLSEERIQHAIIDYYRAFEQRSAWARESLVVAGELEEFEDRLVEEWERHKAILCEKINSTSHDDACTAAGKDLYTWAVANTGHLRIRERVTEGYVTRGAFQMLANTRPSPKVHWHPRFLDQLLNKLNAA